MIDPKLARWSAVLIVLAVLTALVAIAVPVSLVLADSPVSLTRGRETWQAGLSQLPILDRSLLLVVLGLPQVAWLYVVAQVVRLALRYRQGAVFDPANPSCFARIGIALAVMGVLSAAALPFAAWLLYALGDCPWLPDIPWLAALEPDLLLAGAFLFVVGKVMQRGAWLQDEDAHTI